MLIALTVEVSIRKGMGPDFFLKHFDVAFDDLPNDIDRIEVERMAKMEVEQYLFQTDDYPVYGKNWEVVGYHFT